jgi:hypothetical protein
LIAATHNLLKLWRAELAHAQVAKSSPRTWCNSSA